MQTVADTLLLFVLCALAWWCAWFFGGGMYVAD